jgi:hypothetical protein
VIDKGSDLFNSISFPSSEWFQSLSIEKPNSITSTTQNVFIAFRGINFVQKVSVTYINMNLPFRFLIKVPVPRCQTFITPSSPLVMIKFSD